MSLKFESSLRSLSVFEERFCAESSLDRALFCGQSFDLSPPYLRRDEVWLNGEFDTRPIISQIDSLQITGRARFANALIKISNAYQFASISKIKEVIHDVEFLQDEFSVDGIRFTKKIDAGRRTLANDFFYMKCLRPLWRSMESRYSTIQRLREFLKVKGVCAPHDPADDEIYIHVRSGDIFREAVPHPLYGQPPLSFYVKVLKSKPWSHVTLVCEDDRSPVISALRKCIEQLGLRCRNQSGSLLEDLGLLLQARNLIIGRGTFIYPVLCLSRNVKIVYAFDSDERNAWGLNAVPIDFRVVSDLHGGYRNDVLRHWKNTDDQRILMLTYPEESLGPVIC